MTGALCCHCRKWTSAPVEVRYIERPSGPGVALYACPAHVPALLPTLTKEATMEQFEELRPGVGVGNNPGLRAADRAGWHILTPQNKRVAYEPRHKRDRMPWTDGDFRYESRELWAERPLTLADEPPATDAQ